MKWIEINLEFKFKIAFRTFVAIWSWFHVKIIGKIIYVAFIWYLVVLCVPASLVTITSLKSGLILSSLKMLISVLSNKAVLGPIHWVSFLGYPTLDIGVVVNFENRKNVAKSI